ncbi:hypothetical protein BP6252_14155 [Coleophoma cylindrospora]|uniref:Protein kinase domain-containing protein n=1 Tax=Coleophoma cylindrospora TaxID=1849047 RepID=A0A3D8Q3K5_9HELO|nr:hypothetical protein BP6252_14155 [Coleophoma cylindrospora]
MSVPGDLLYSHRASTLLNSCLKHGQDISAYMKQLVACGLDDFEDINFDRSFEQIEDELRFLIDLLTQFSDQMLGHLLRLLQNLDEWLQTACGRLELSHQVMTSCPTLAIGIRSQHTLEIKADINCLMEKMDNWQNSFLQRLFLILLLGKPFSAAESSSQSWKECVVLQDLCSLRNAIQAVTLGDVQKSLFLSSVPDLLNRLPNSNFWVAQDESNMFSIIEYKEIDPAVTLRDSKKAVHDLVMIMSQANPVKMGILQCRGFARIDLENYFQLVYNYPSGFKNPRSLRDLLLDENNKKGPLHSISNRFEFAKQLARAVLYVHSTGYVHKSIRPDTILIFELENADSARRYPRYFGRPYLLGFDQLRKDGPHSNRVSDGEWQKDIYRHPTRQGLDPQKVYSMRHDIYSLGVVLLEVSLWNSFVLWDDTHNVYVTSEYSRKLFDNGSTRTAGPNLKSPKDIQRALLKAAERQVRLSMGDKFSSIVIDCLNCVNGNLLGSWDDAEDEDELDIGIKYIEGIIERLEALYI